MDEVAQPEPPWFCRRYLPLLVVSTGPLLAFALVALAGPITSTPLAAAVFMLGWATLMVTIGLFVFVLKARKVFRLASRTHPPPLHPPRLVGYLIVFVALTGLTWLAASPEPASSRPKQRVTSHDTNVFGGPIIPNIAAEVAGGVIGEGLHRAEQSAKRAVSTVVSGLFLVFIVLPGLAADYSGRRHGWLAGLRAAGREPT